MFSRKSQVALEFLMTYGWAILVVLVAIGALAYFGVLSPDRFLPNRCTLQSGIACIDHKATSTDVTVVIRNSLGYDLSSVDIEVEDCGASAVATTLNNGDQSSFSVTCTSTLTGSKLSGALNVTYTNVDTGLTHKNQGTLTTKIE